MKARYATLAAVVALATIVIGLGSGCDLGDLIRVQTPVGIQESVGLPQSLTLNESEAQYQRWTEDVRADAAQWQSSIERSNQVRQLLGQITLNALDQVGPTLAGVPVLGTSLPLLGTLVGLWVGRGTLSREKEKSFNAGQRKAAELVNKPAAIQT